MIMPHKGVSLKRWLRQGETSIDDCHAQIYHQLQRMHKAGYTHRDVKPDNVLVTRDAHGEITALSCDFGLSILTKDCQQKWPGGSSRWASHSALNGKRQQPEDDLQSLTYMYIWAATWANGDGKLPWDKDAKNNSKCDRETTKMRHRKLAKSKERFMKTSAYGDAEARLKDAYNSHYAATTMTMSTKKVR